MNKKKLAVFMSGLLLYSGFMSVADAEETSDEVEEVVVTADRVKELNPQKSTVISEEQIKVQGARNVAEALKDVPGLYITSNDAQGKAVAMFRGSDAENTKVYVDGVPLSPVGDGKVDLSAIMAENIAKIEVIKGAAPVVYGINAPGGVIIITTKKGGDKNSQMLSVVTGSHGDESMFLSSSGRTGKLSYLLDVKKEHSDGYTTHSAIKEYNNYNIKLGYDISPKASVTVLGSSTVKYSQLPNRIDPATGEILTISSGASSTDASFLNNTFNWEYTPWESRYAGLLFNQKLSDNNDLSLKWYRTSEIAHLKAYGYENEDWLHQYVNGWVKGLEMQDTIKTSTANTVILGWAHEDKSYYNLSDAVYSYINVVNGKTTTGYYSGTARSDYNYTGKSFYLQDNLNVSRKLAVSFGVRHEDINDFARVHPWGDVITPDNVTTGIDAHGNPTKPQASFSYAMTGRTTLHGSFGESFRWPNIQERLGPGGVYGAYGTSYDLSVNPLTGATIKDSNGNAITQQWWKWPDGTWHLPVGSDHVEPEEAINREIGLAHTFPFGLKLDATYFYKNIKNMIKGQEGSGNLGGSLLYYNIPQVTMHGYEVEGSFPISKQIKGILSYSLTTAYDPVAFRQVVDIPYRKCSFGFIYTGKDGINTYLSLNYTGSYMSEFTTSSGNDYNNKSVTDFTVPGHSTVDLKVSKTKGDREYYFRITNLFDKKYYQGYYLLSPGRCVEIGGTIKY